MVILYSEFFQLWNLLDRRATFKQYSQSTAQYDQMGQQKNKLMTQEQELKSKINAITCCADNCKTCVEHLKGLCKPTNDIHLNSYTISENSIAITITCPTIKHAEHYLATLATQHKFNALAIASVQPNSKNGLTVTLKASS